MQPTKRIPGQQDILDEIILRNHTKGHILDIGAGAGHASRAFLSAGWQVSATGFDIEAYGEDGKSALTEIEEITVHRDVDITHMHMFEDASFDAVWCAHVIEHVMDTGAALKEVRRILKPDGACYISVPPFKHKVVGGHVHAGWNLGLLMYVLAVAGFELAEGSFVRHGYNLFASVKRGKGPLEEGHLHFANGDLETLQEHGRFPTGFNAKQGFEGNFWSWNWSWTQLPKEVEPHPKTVKREPPFKIAFFIPWITKGNGGTENVGHMMANAMATRGHEIHIFTFDDDKAPSKWNLNASIQLHYLAEGDALHNDGQILLEMATLSPDLIVGLHLNRTLLRYTKCARKLNIPLVLSEHCDPRLPERMGRFSKAERLMAFHGATKIHMLLQDHVTTLPPYMRGNIHVIPNTVPPARTLAKAGATDTQKVLFAIARFVSLKNIDFLIRAFANIADKALDWDLHIMGYGPEEQRLKTLASSFKCGDRIKFLGAGDPYDVLPNVHLFAMPSMIEGFPLTTLEAMSHALPVIGFKACKGVKGQIVHGKTGYLAAGNLNDAHFSAYLLKLMLADDLRDKMGQASLKRYKAVFSNAVIHDAWENMFIQAVHDFEKTLGPSVKNVIEIELDNHIYGSPLS